MASVDATRRTTAPYTALVLAGSRTARDRFAESQGHTRKALVPVAGVPMLVRVVHALAGASDVERIHVHGDDEATTALDPATERSICETLRELRGSMTLIAICHHGHLVEAADLVYRVEGGRIDLVRSSAVGDPREVAHA